MWLQSTLIGIISSILSVLIIGIVLQLIIYCKLHRLSGKSYIGYDIDGTQHENKEYSVSYKFRPFNPTLIIRQKSSIKGNWESKIYIGQSNFLEGVGNYKYSDDSGTWGTQRIIVNLEDKIIYITAKSKAKPRTDKYIIKKIK